MSVLSPQMKTAGRVFAWTLATLMLVAVSIALWVGVRGTLAYQHLARVQSEASRSAMDVAADPSAASPTIARLASEAAEARELTSDPVWTLASLTPWVGPQLEAFSTLAASMDQLLGRSLLPLATAAQGVKVDSLRPVNGRIDPNALSNIAGPADEASRSASAATDAVRAINRTPLVGIVDSAVNRAIEVFEQTAGSIDTLARTSHLLPSMLGGKGEREYLVLVQNNAEWRSLGGISGTAILLKTVDGAVSLVRTESATSLSQSFDGPVVDLPKQITDLYGTKPARYFHNLTQVPDFSVVGASAREMYLSATGVDVDGVLAVDPVALSYLLRATGPVPIASGDTLTAENAAALLLNEVYLRYESPEQQDAFFTAATGAVFQALLNSQASAPELVAALGRAGAEHRLYIWSKEPNEQAILDGSTIAGLLPVTDERHARFGVYLNDGTGSKMSYYVVPEVSLAWAACQATGQKGVRQLVLHVKLTNTAPIDAGTTLPWYITGGGVYRVAPGTARVVANVLLPEGFEIVSSTSPTESPFTSSVLEGRDVMTFSSDLQPAAATEVTVTVRGTSSAVDAEALVTPTANSSIDPVVEVSCDLTHTSPGGGLS
ncbi:DUF4012 domain-containing protein [Microbacterium trichothecenolyticum]|uniref:DUF4012 domain-containing protein n=1 Tax=Microbacterium trichothecenolyticum TaxID=69370 RepID=A0ABU0TZV1_MICTR|nr:DUF4012 domain-containing protein [Microbacterium trichothecenolyticum]MDQ1124472.1 hypothetical protein [Microbacterium trichothecenolyticum]